jgi:SAM-dependent methyltransferase
VTQTVPYFDTFPELFDRFTRIWDGISTDFDDWILAALPALAGSGVDLGCGAGRHSVLLAERVEKVLGVDVSERMLATARTRRDRPNVSYQYRSDRRTNSSWLGTARWSAQRAEEGLEVRG